MQQHSVGGSNSMHHLNIHENSRFKIDLARVANKSAGPEPRWWVVNPGNASELHRIINSMSLSLARLYYCPQLAGIHRPVAGAFAKRRLAHHIPPHLGNPALYSAAPCRANEPPDEIPLPVCRRPTMCPRRGSVWCTGYARHDLLGHPIPQRRIRRLRGDAESGIIPQV